MDLLGQRPAEELIGNQFPRISSETYQKTFKKQGLVVIKKFISSKNLEKIKSEIHSIKDEAYYNEVTGNAYLSDPPPGIPQAHIKRHLEKTSLSVIAYDQIPENFLLRKIYEDHRLLLLIRDIVGREEIYRYSCPLGALNIALMKEGDYLRWHFDQSEFVVSIPLQDADRGGRFEFSRNIRTPEQPNYDKVRALIKGHSKGQDLETPPGSLVLFQGKNTLHRVSPVEGRAIRMTALLGFSFEKNAGGSDYLKKIRYGRVDPIR